MQLREYEPEPRPVLEAEENLRVIRELMERSTRYSTFSGLSGISAGLVSIAGCVVQQFWVGADPARFILNWGLVILLVIGIDFMLTKRRAPMVGKTINSRLGRQMFLAAFPGLATGALLTLFFLQHGLTDRVYPFWMLCYGIAVSAVGLFSQREVARLGAAFLATGALTFILSSVGPFSAYPAALGLVLTAVSFGGFHIAYGMAVSRRG